MKNILSVDFDIIMDSYLEFYNNKERFYWSEKLILYPGLASLPVNANHYQKITKLILDIIPNIPKENIHFIINHDEICNYLDVNEKYSIINIDHHHDWGYLQGDGLYKKNLNIGNWVQFLFVNNMLVSYCWIHNLTSDPPNPDIRKIKSYSDYLLKDWNVGVNYKYDELYICLSPEFVPPYYHALFNIWIDLIGKIKNTTYMLESLGKNIQDYKNKID